HLAGRAGGVGILHRVGAGELIGVRVVGVHHVRVRQCQDVAVPVQYHGGAPLHAVLLHCFVDHVLGVVLQIGVDRQVHAATWLGRGAGAFPGGDDLALGADLDGELAVGALEFFVQAGLQPRGAVAGGIDPAEDLPGGVAVGVDALEGFLGGDPGNV